MYMYIIWLEDVDLVLKGDIHNNLFDQMLTFESSCHVMW